LYQLIISVLSEVFTETRDSQFDERYFCAASSQTVVDNFTASSAIESILETTFFAAQRPHEIKSIRRSDLGV
jgi:hypothetical protein